MVKLDGERWDYECFCKKDHVSYSSRTGLPISELDIVENGKKSNSIGGYRETCQDFSFCKSKDRIENGTQLTEDARYKIFVPEEPIAWEAAKQMVKYNLK